MQGGGHRLAGLLEWALENLHEPLTITDLARRAHMNTHHLGRQFAAVVGTSPPQWLLTQRVRRAQELLETTEDSIDQVAKSVGIGTGTTLRRHFDRTLGVAPEAYPEGLPQLPRNTPGEYRDFEGSGLTRVDNREV